jgi:PQQ system protein
MNMRGLVSPMLCVATLVASGCSYGKLLRPKVLKQLSPEMVNLLNELPNLDDPNEAIMARLFAHGGLSRADMGADGVMRDEIMVPENEFIWRPAIIVMERAGELELQFSNNDQNLHAAFLPSEGDRQSVMLPMGAGGKSRIRLTQPGLYWFGCPISNHAGRGMLGLVIVKGEVPGEAKLDRPKQKRGGGRP